MTIYAVGDIHGQFDMLKAAFDRIEADRAREGTGDARAVMIGDYNDRGPDTKGTLDWLIERAGEGAPIVCIAGNHDRMMLAFIEDDFELDPRTAEFNWLAENLGGRTTLGSYGVEVHPWTSRAATMKAAREAVPRSHLDFLRALPLTYEEDGLLFAHAGVNPDRPLDDQLEEDLLWIRDPFLNCTRDLGALIVHGHTPTRQIEHAGNRINIDTGAGYGRPLSAVAIEQGVVFELTETGRRPVSRHPTGAT